MSRVVTVCGATGAQGGAVVRELAKHPEFSVRALTRNVDGPAAKKLAALPNVTLHRADFSDPVSLAKAFDGAEVVYALTNFYDSEVQNDPTNLLEARQGCIMADMAKEKGVKLFIWSTVPSALVRTGARFDSPRLVENKTTVSLYLKSVGLPHIDFNMGFYMDNCINFGQLSKAPDGTIEIAQPLLEPEVKIGMIWLERDLGRIIAGILHNYQAKEGLVGSAVYGVGGLYSVGELAAEIKRQRGGQARVVTTPSSGLEQLDVMYGYYNRWGIYNEVQLPHPTVTGVGVKLSTLADFVQGAVIPHLDTL